MDYSKAIQLLREELEYLEGMDDIDAQAEHKAIQDVLDYIATKED